MTSVLAGATRWPPVGAVDFGDFRRLRPISAQWGFDRGIPIDRHYIERFLAAHAADIRGHVLEIQDREYTVRFGGDRVTRSDVLHISAANPLATLVADLSNAPHLPHDTFDCIILTQTLQFILDARAAIATAHRILAPGGVLLVAAPGITKISMDEAREYGEFRPFTRMSLETLLAESFGEAGVVVESSGNVLAATAFLHGLAAGELNVEELSFTDPEFEVIVTARAAKSSGGAST
jgi:SAM-dependent methyltransferase